MFLMLLYFISFSRFRSSCTTHHPQFMNPSLSFSSRTTTQMKPLDMVQSPLLERQGLQNERAPECGRWGEGGGSSKPIAGIDEILRPALERDLARNKKLESFKLIELTLALRIDRHNTIKINLGDQSEENAICSIDIHLWIAFNLRTLQKITIISGNPNHQAIGRYLLRKYVRLRKPGRF
ncbi:unnamed protein product [Lactuca saligna]|uniref:Uncharacterized protein n=1 Tax=Lactuca saligna TaxID=75948 RepID=A0AA36A0S4_LACSI|nr:unnamed protein product [Lactuca saligna]